VARSYIGDESSVGAGELVRSFGSEFRGAVGLPFEKPKQETSDEECLTTSD
jgi:hypothetical protein